MSALKKAQPPHTRLAFAWALTASAVGCGHARTRAEVEAIALVERLCGTIKTDAAQAGRPVIEVALGGTQALERT